MPYGDWINDLPTGFFLVVHIAAFAIGAGFAWLAFKRELTLLWAAFSLYALAEAVYMTYHLDWTVFLFAHTIAEVLDLTAFVLVFAAAVYATVRQPALGASRG
jgi:membrane protein implicated in regulation of membrane protease activity